MDKYWRQHLVDYLVTERKIACENGNWYEADQINDEIKFHQEYLNE